MNTITYSQRYLPHEINTKFYAVKLYRTGVGIKWQMDVKYVPTACYSGSVPQKYYQYTVIDEASREHFIYTYMEQCRIPSPKENGQNAPSRYHVQETGNNSQKNPPTHTSS